MGQKGEMKVSSFLEDTLFFRELFKKDSTINFVGDKVFAVGDKCFYSYAGLNFFGLDLNGRSVKVSDIASVAIFGDKLVSVSEKNDVITLQSADAKLVIPTAPAELNPIKFRGTGLSLVMTAERLSVLRQAASFASKDMSFDGSGWCVVTKTFVSAWSRYFQFRAPFESPVEFALEKRIVEAILRIVPENGVLFFYDKSLLFENGAHSFLFWCQPIVDGGVVDSTSLKRVDEVFSEKNALFVTRANFSSKKKLFDGLIPADGEAEVVLESNRLQVGFGNISLTYKLKNSFDGRLAFLTGTKVFANVVSITGEFGVLFFENKMLFKNKAVEYAAAISKKEAGD